MATEFYVGKRLSYNGSLCTVIWQGCLEGLSGQWVGVEWDDASRGKHDGRHGKTRYFHCWSAESTAASFLRPNSKSIEQPQQILDAVRQKYGSEDYFEKTAARDTVTISGKEVDEVGFDRITQKQSAWSELETVSLDGLRIRGYRRGSSCLNRRSQDELCIIPRGWKWKELDLSRNLFEDWDDVANICSNLKELRLLKVNGNRFQISSEHGEPKRAFEQLVGLSLADIAAEWGDILTLCTQRRFPNLQTLCLAFNSLNNPPKPLSDLFLPTLRNLDLTSCNLSTLRTLAPLTTLPIIHTLVLRSNPLTTLSTNPHLTFPSLQTLDLTSTHLPSLSSLDPILATFPTLTSLKTTNTPLKSSHPSARLLTIARLPGISTLNSTPILPHERQNAELYYLNTLTPLLLAAESAKQEKEIVETHPQWHPLCEKYGEPEPIALKRNPPPIPCPSTTPNPSSSSTANEPKKQQQQQPTYPPLSLGANLITITFTFHHNPSPSPTPGNANPQTPPTTTRHVLSIPKQTTIYRLKCLLGRVYGVPALETKLVLETEEWDPVVAERAEDDDWSCCSEDDEDDEEEEEGDGRERAEEKRKEKEKEKEKGLWVRREIELVDSTRPVGFWVEGREARVRVERRRLSVFD